jgi:hypothetical protein
MNRLFTADQDAVRTIHRQLAHLATIRGTGAPPASVTAEQIAIFMETAFWASLRSNEGRAVRFCATIAASIDVHGPMAFAEPVRYDEEQIAKIAPALPPRGCLIVSTSTDPFTIWGFGRGRPGASVQTLTVDVSEPGVLRIGVGPFHPFAVLDGRSHAIIAETSIALAVALQRALRKPTPLEEFIEQQANWHECLALADLARIVLAEGHGGTLLVVPEAAGSWEESLKFAHRLAVPDTTVCDVIRQNLRDQTTIAEASVQVSTIDVSDHIKHSILAGLAHRPLPLASLVEPYATLASVDGAVVVTKDMRIVGFGAKISVDSPPGATVCMLRPLSGLQELVPVPIAESGGTRHQSAVRFVLANKDTVALVVSQDRHLSMVHWHLELDAVVMMRNAEWFE